jgi:hypothetical protein
MVRDACEKVVRTVGKAEIKMPDSSLHGSPARNQHGRGPETGTRSSGEVVLQKSKAIIILPPWAKARYKSPQHRELEGAIGLSPVKLDRTKP